MRIFKSLGILFFALLAAIGVGLLVIPKDRVLNQALVQVEKQIGRKITVRGDVGLRFFPVLGLSAKDVHVANAAWSSTGENMIQADQIVFGVDTRAALSGKIRVQEIRLVTPSILLETHSDGRVNWALSPDAPQQQAEATPQSEGQSAQTSLPEIQAVSISNGTIWILDHAAGSETKLSSIGIDMAWPSPDQPMHVKARAVMQGDAIDLDLRLVDVPEAINSAKAELQIASASFAQFSASGTLNVDYSEKPNVTGTLALGPLDLRSVQSGAENTQTQAPEGWSNTAIDASTLALLNADVSVSGPSIRMDGLTLGAFDAAVALTDARAVVALKALKAYEGSVIGQAVVNARKGLSASLKADITNVQVLPILQDMVEIQAIRAPVSVDIDVLVSGRSINDMMKSAQGKVSLTSEGGKIDGIDLDKLLRTGNSASGTTVFERFEMAFVGKSGNFSAEKFNLRLGHLGVTGTGSVDLGQQSLDMLLSPKLDSARNGEGLSVPIRINGPWAAPKITPDLEATLDQNLAKEKDAALKKVEEKAKSALKEKTGIEVQQGESLEDAVKKKLEEEAKKGLLNLFNKK